MTNENNGAETNLECNDNSWLKYDLFSHYDKFYGIGPYDVENLKDYPCSKRIAENLALKIAHVTGAYWATQLNDSLSRFAEAKKNGKQVEYYPGKSMNPYERSLMDTLGHEIAYFSWHIDSPIVQENKDISSLFFELARARTAHEVAFSKHSLKEDPSDINSGSYDGVLRYARKLFGEEAVEEIPSHDEDNSELVYLANRFDNRVRPVLEKFGNVHELEKMHCDILKDLGDDPRLMFKKRILAAIFKGMDILPNRYNKPGKSFPSYCIVPASSPDYGAFYQLTERLREYKGDINQLDAIRAAYREIERLIEKLPDDKREVVQAHSYLGRWDLERTLFNEQYPTLLGL